MRLLLDTHAFVWSMAGSQRLSARAAEAIADGANEVLVSAASAYEIEFKRTRDADLAALPPDLEAVMRALDFTWLPIQHGHAIAAGSLPRVTGDPFDRLIVAQAISERALLVSCDRAIAAYGAAMLW